jgi:hypothetical protein
MMKSFPLSMSLSLVRNTFTQVEFSPSSGGDPLLRVMSSVV